MPELTILIPVYNVEEYLRECLDSVIAQTVSDMEIICVDDGSTDSSPEILREYKEKDSRIQIVHQENGGYGKAMNTGLLAAKGKFIGIVEPDDYVPEEMYENLLEAAEYHKLDFVKADFYSFYEDPSSKKREYALHRLSRKQTDYNRILNPESEPALLDTLIDNWSGIYLRSFLVENNIRHNETPGASYQDTGFYFQVFTRAKRGMLLNMPYYRYRFDNPNSSKNSREKVYATDEEYRFIRRILLKDPGVWDRFKYMYWKKRFTSYDFTLKRIAPEYVKEYLSYTGRIMRLAEAHGLLKRECYTKGEWQALQLFLTDPESYYLRSRKPKNPIYARIASIPGYGGLFRLKRASCLIAGMAKRKAICEKVAANRSE